MAEEGSLVGTAMVLSIDGQRVTGRVTAERADHLEVDIVIHQPAKGYNGIQARAVMPSGQVVAFDLGPNAFYAKLTVHVPLPAQAAAPPGDERRRFFRMGIECPVEVLESGPHGRDVVRGRGTTLNLSGGGMLVEFENAMLPGIYQFRVAMGSDSLEVIGRLLRKGASTTVCPVEFVDMHEVDRTRVIRFIFNRVRALKNGAPADPPPGQDKVAATKDEEPGYIRRREKYGKPNKFRYW